MAALIGRVWRSAVTHVLREVSNVSYRIQPNDHPCTKLVLGKACKSLQPGRSLSSSPHSLSGDKPTTDAMTENMGEVAQDMSMKSKTFTKNKRRKKGMNKGTSKLAGDRERKKKEESVLLSEELETSSPRIWVMDKYGEFVLKDVKSSKQFSLGGETMKKMMEDPPDNGQVWSIPDIYESEEFRRCVQEAERSILVHCPYRKTTECITFCERMAPVTRVLKIHNKAILVTFESDISNILAGGFQKYKSDAVSIKQTEKRVFQMGINVRKFNSPQQPMCTNISMLKQRNYQRLLMNETVRGWAKSKVKYLVSSIPRK